MPQKAPTPRASLVKGAIDTTPMILAAIPFGMLYGALAQSAGMDFYAAMGMSILVFAGSSQFVAVSLLALSAPIIIIVAATFVINFRHLMYSANLMPRMQNYPARLRALMAFWMTDETFAVVTHRLQKPIDEQTFKYYFLGSALFMYSNWQICSALGFFLGSRLEDPAAWGLDMAMVVAFIGAVAPLLKNAATWACALTALFSGVLTHDWPHQSGLLFTIAVSIFVGMLLNRSRQTT